MRRIVVTGANKGIGQAICQGILAQHEDTLVYLASRDLGRGRAAAAALTEPHPGWAQRVEVVELDVTSDASVAAAAQQVSASSAGDKLHGLVNNAGIGQGALAEVLDVNIVGVRRVCDAFLPLLDVPRGRIVNITSAAGPSFVATCSTEMQRFFLDGTHDWSHLRALIDECLGMAGDAAAFAARGLGDGGAYGLSKALANTYTLMLARQHPELRINACTPGFIETDLTRHYASSQNKSAAELGMKPPEAGAVAPLHLLFGELDGNGRFYGSDAKRSPLDRYRSPGTAPYEGP